jgi:hypothetical protein
VERQGERTSYSDATHHFCDLCPEWWKVVQQWRTDPRYRVAVVPFVEQFAVSALYGVLPGDVLAVSRKTEHALGDVKREVAESVLPIVNWNPPFALQHTLHYALEVAGGPLTLQDFRHFCSTEPHARRMLWEPSREAIAAVIASGVPSGLARAAMKWRVGLAYYSFLRELYVIAVLRSELGADIRYHPVADVLFRIDGWAGTRVLHLYIGNPQFRLGASGRKPRLACSNLQVVEMELSPRREFGVVHLPDPGDIAAAWGREAGPQPPAPV